ncbi:MAG: ATP-binding cassette domain-containing protein, partial [Puniceicoccales bacterium]|nr:ATP-binding cassette domain-containing protein [Puniceicoccales bacterium]
GANGSGKTSLLAVLTGYLAESGGTVSLAGATRGADDWREVRKRVGIVSAVLARMISDDEPALSVVVGGRGATLNLWAEPSAPERLAALALMRRTGCAAVAGQVWATLSQGERQRVLISRALCSGLAVLVLDEPCAGLDPVARERFLRMLGKLSVGPGAVPLVFVTHHVEEITPLFTHALLLRKGRVLASGPLAATLTSANLSALFGVSARLRKTNGRYALSVAA